MKFIPNPGNKNKGEEAGFIIKGQDYAAIKLITTAEGCKMRFVKCENAMKGKKEQTLAEIPVSLESLEKPYTQKYAVDDIPQTEEEYCRHYSLVSQHQTSMFVPW